MGDGAQHERTLQEALFLVREHLASAHLQLVELEAQTDPALQRRSYGAFNGQLHRAWELSGDLEQAIWRAEGCPPR